MNGMNFVFNHNFRLDTILVFCTHSRKESLHRIHYPGSWGGLWVFNNSRFFPSCPVCRILQLLKKHISSRESFITVTTGMYRIVGNDNL